MSDDDEKTELNVDGLDKLAKAFKKVPTVLVGILGDGAARETLAGPGVSHAPLSNAQIGAFHEFGTTKTPMRSFLRVPLIDNLDKELKASGVISKNAIDEAIKSGSFHLIMSQVGIVAEGIVLGAFDTGGYGKWAPLKPATLAGKKNHQVLVETAQLRNAITNEVVDGDQE